MGRDIRGHILRISAANIDIDLLTELPGPGWSAALDKGGKICQHVTQLLKLERLSQLSKQK